MHFSLAKKLVKSLKLYLFLYLFAKILFCWYLETPDLQSLMGGLQDRFNGQSPVHLEMVLGPTFKKVIQSNKCPPKHKKHISSTINIYNKHSTVFSPAHGLNSECVSSACCCVLSALIVSNFPLVLAVSRGTAGCLYPWPSGQQHIHPEQPGGLVCLGRGGESRCHLRGWSPVPEESHELLWHILEWARISVRQQVPGARSSEGQSRRAGQTGIHAGEEEFQFSGY